jgi:tRNA modification GTPase
MGQCCAGCRQKGAAQILGLMAERHSTDTIYALSSGRGRAGIAVIRVSGLKAAAALTHLTGRAPPEPRVAALRQFRTQTGEAIDDGLALWFPAPASFTGENVVEFHIHGGRAVVEDMLAALRRLEGLRPAEAGEFTRRAVENGKFDLTQAEALADLINAETEAQRRQALRQYEGALADVYEGWRTALTRAAAWAEAAIDFSDEELPLGVLANARAQAADILVEIREHLADSRRGEILRDGFYLTVIGPPNSGKSSFVNALAGREVAIVSEIAGTTRDILEVHLNLDGYPVILADTAGLRETSDVIETEGVRRAVERAERADAVLLLLDTTTPQAASLNMEMEPALTVWNKVDIASPPGSALGVSVRTGEGMDALLRRIGQIVRRRLDGGEAPALTRERHRAALEQAKAALTRATGATEPELLAEELRFALRYLGQITGRVDLEDLLDVIFRDFCIGK